jgi:pimeloyl-ACP methyl ester carboxylesterase
VTGRDGSALPTRSFGGTDRPNVVIILGLGNRVRGVNEEWFCGRIARRGYRVTAIQLPTNGSSFTEDLLAPVQAIHDEVDPIAVLGHSLGGLVLAHLHTAAGTVYCSPWWGFRPDQTSWLRAIVIRHLPIESRIVPVSIDTAAVGARMRSAAADAMPSRLSPRFLAAVDSGQRTRPRISEDAEVFVCLADELVGVRPIGEAVSPQQVHLFGGGHEIFSVARRDDVVERVGKAIDRVASDTT